MLEIVVCAKPIPERGRHLIEVETRLFNQMIVESFYHWRRDTAWSVYLSIGGASITKLPRITADGGDTMWAASNSISGLGCGQ